MIAPDLETAISAPARPDRGRARPSSRSPGRGSRPNAASRISARPAACGPRTSRSRSTTSWRAREMRDEAWRRRFVMEESFAKAKPGRGHRALASLYRAGKVPALVTQNIDNLHQASGIAPEDVVELHGNTTYAVCLECDAALRIVVGQAKIRGRRRARARLRLRRLHQDRYRVVRAGDAGRGDAARRAIEPQVAICFSPSARRWWCGRRRDFR